MPRLLLALFVLIAPIPWVGSEYVHQQYRERGQRSQQAYANCCSSSMSNSRVQCRRQRIE
jgi:hypothetical protein